MITNIHLCAALPIACELERCCLEGAHPEGEDVDGRGEGHRVLWVIRGCTVAIVIPTRANHIGGFLPPIWRAFSPSRNSMNATLRFVRLKGNLDVMPPASQPASQTDISSLVGKRELST